MCFFVVAGARARSLPPVGCATNFSSVTYFEPPHDSKKWLYRLSGAEAMPLPDAKLDLKKMSQSESRMRMANWRQSSRPRDAIYTLDGIGQLGGPHATENGRREVSVSRAMVWRVQQSDH